jgi:hypothetical protein
MKERRPFRFRWLIAAIVLLAACQSREPSADARASAKARAALPAGCTERPNVLLISLDTLGFDATSLGPVIRRWGRRAGQRALDVRH